jgi:hypothetical protein
MKILDELKRRALEESTHPLSNESDVVIYGHKIDCSAVLADSTQTARKAHHTFRFKLNGKVIAKAKLLSFLDSFI